MTAVEIHPGRARRSGEAGGPASRWSTRTCASCEPRVRPCARRRACSGLGVLARRPDLRWRAQPLPELQLELLAAAASGSSRAARRLRRVHAERRRERGGRRCVGPRGRAARREWPQYAHPKRPEFLLTLPHRDARRASSSPACEGRSDEPRASRRDCARGRTACASEADGRCGPRARTRGGGGGRDGSGRAACGGGRARGRRRARARGDDVRHARAVRAPRHDASVRRRDRRGRRRTRGGRRARSESGGCGWERAPARRRRRGRGRRRLGLARPARSLADAGCPPGGRSWC